MVILFFVLLTCFGGISGSHIELNETLLQWFPPLYQLEDWKSCQRIGDTYCSVEAALVSREPSPLLDVLKEYSSQWLKHYNRTQIHRGVCVSRCAARGNHSDVLLAAQDCINDTVQQYQLEAVALSAKWCSTVGSQGSLRAARVMGIIVATVIIIGLVATAIGIVNDKNENKYLAAFSLIHNWKILTYDRSKPRHEPRMKDLSCLEGIRVIGIEFVIFAHVLLIYVYSYIDNPEFIENMYDNLGWKIVLNSPVWLQAFFALTGFLTAYTWLIVSEKKDVTIMTCVLAIINRWIRLTPVALFALWFTIAWYPMLGSGPQWSWVVDREAQECTERWVHHVLYIHNHLPLGKFCMGHTWYLAVDMQLHIFGTILIFVLLRYRRAVAPVLLTILAASVIAAGCVVYFYNLTPIITAQTPEDLRTMFLNSKILPYLYLPMWMNLPGYVCGVATAFIHYNNQQHSVVLSSKKWFYILSQLSLHLASMFLLLGVFFLADHPPPLWASAVYSAVDRTVVSILFSVFLLGLVSGCKSHILSMLSWRGFHVLGRLSYCVYIIHFIILRFAVAYNTQLGHASVFSMLSLLIVSTVFTYLASVPVCLFIEIPCIQIWKSFFERPQSPSEETRNPKLDLVSTVRPSNVP